MILLAEGVAELNANVRWMIALHLELLEVVVLSPETAGKVVPNKERAWNRAQRASEQRKKEAEEQFLVDFVWAVSWEWRQDHPEYRLLADLYRRDARRRENSGTPDSRRKPTAPEGKSIARALLEDLPEVYPFDPEEEALTVAQVIAFLHLPPFGHLTRAKARDCIKQSQSIPVYFDALILVYDELKSRGKSIRCPLIKWRQEVDAGRILRPDPKPIPANRPADPAKLKVDIHLQFAVAVLERVGIRPQGTSVSGCSIVAGVTGFSEDTVVRTWKECTWRTSFDRVMQKYAKAIAMRTGMHPTS